MSAEAEQMLALGESGRYEFKRDAEAVSPKVIAALANWVALESEREVAHLLVGVDEKEDADTGLVYGVPCGLPKGLDKAVARLQDVASKTRPIPVDVHIIEEAVKEQVPFLRLEVRPTMAPHFDDEGRRQTRQGRSTRALTDDELLRVYLDREAGSFASRFRYAAVELRNAVGAVGTQVDQIAVAIDHTIAQPLERLAGTASLAARAASDAETAANDAESAASNAASAADDAGAAATMVGYDVDNVAQLVRDLQSLVENLQNDSVASFVARVTHVRMKVWWVFTVDTWNRSSARAERLAQDLRSLLSVGISLDQAHNSWELRVWEDLLSHRKALRPSKRTMKWWESVIKEVDDFRARPVYEAPELPDLRAEIREDIDKARDDPDSLTRRFVDRMNG